jgi:hypothetical protein
MFYDDDHVRIMNIEGLDCLITWRDMKVVASSKRLNFTEDFENAGSHPLMDSNPDNATWHVMPRLQRQNHRVALTIEHEMYFERKRRETSTYECLNLE